MCGDASVCGCGGNAVEDGFAEVVYLFVIGEAGHLCGVVDIAQLDEDGGGFAFAAYVEAFFYVVWLRVLLYVAGEQHFAINALAKLYASGQLFIAFGHGHAYLQLIGMGIGIAIGAYVQGDERIGR